ncbi:MAG: glycogen/starch/alpha-glucan phosphorylase [Desulfobacterales bacterium]|jgi:starch phosphorylase|nr:glycogen/starch/alpha-glucan phosphorylase [Desulfobacterales bacterium]
MTSEQPDFSQPARNLLSEIQHHIVSYLGNDFTPYRKDTYYYGLALTIRDRLVERWLKTQRKFHDQGEKRVYYMSMEFLPGRFLLNNILNLQISRLCGQALEYVGIELEDLEEQEWDAGLGNGGLGRLASCFLDSMATLKLPGYGCGIRYDYGIFYQEISEGFQVERCDNWMRNGSPWEVKRRGFLYEIKFYGRSEPYVDASGQNRYRWVDTDNIMAMACDYLIPAYAGENVNNMRLWSALSSREFNLQEFNEGDYIGAVEAKVLSENISKVLYPRDEGFAGKELRLKQQYFFVAATLRDILRRFKKSGNDFARLPDSVAVQLNDTHPCVSIPELMRILVDEEDMTWDSAWEICGRVFAYTNHTVLPEALETWPVDLMWKVLPRHMEIIYEINRQFLAQIERRYPGDAARRERMAIVHGGMVRMANLSIIGSHTVNGVSELHTRILKERLFKEFDEYFPGRFINITNGISPRRWLIQINPGLSDLISSAIGEGWKGDLKRLRELVPCAKDSQFLNRWRAVKQQNKERMCRYILRKTGSVVSPDTLFDVQVKRIHEYKRQLLNALHAITLYNRIKANGAGDMTPRTVIFSGKAAPGYFMAKLIIKLINSVAETVNNDPLAAGRLQVIFLPNYCVSQAEKIVPAADLSEQISTAGMEASGTGNMKLALNGALTIGTLDGANVEILQEVGGENIFIFGLKADEVAALRNGGYNPRETYEKDEELKTAVDLISSGFFSKGDIHLFKPIVDSLLINGDYYCVLADYRAYMDTQDLVSRLYLDPDEWARRAILNTANMGKFSSDRAVAEYAQKVWSVRPVEV